MWRMNIVKLGMLVNVLGSDGGLNLVSEMVSGKMLVSKQLYRQLEVF